MESYKYLVDGFKELGSDYFWKFTDAQLEKIDRKIAKQWASRLDEWGYERDWWTNDRHKDYVVALKAVTSTLEIHITQRIFMDEKHIQKWVEEPKSKGKFKWLNQSTDSDS